MKNIMVKIVAFLVAASGLLIAVPVLAATPVLSVSQNGSTVTLNVSNADPNQPVYLYQTQSSGFFTGSNSLGNTDSNGNFNSTQTITFDGSSNPVQLYVMVDNLQSPKVQISPGSCTSGCVSGNLPLSQTSVSLNTGQTATVIATPSSGTVYVSNNTNSSVANYLLSGNSIIITGQNSGSTTLTVCASNSTSQCGSILITINGGSSTTLNFSNASPVVTAGQSSTVTIYSPSNSNSSSYYVQSNSNSAIITNPSISGSTLYFSGGTPGNATLNICQTSSSYCGTLAVIVGGNGSGGITISPNTLTLTVGSTGTATINNTTGPLSISNNSNSSVVSASVSNTTGATSQTVTVYATVAGSSTLTICPTGSSAGCVYLYVQVASSGSGNSSGGISFSVPNPVMTIGQSQSIAIYSSNSSATYSVSNNSSSNVVSLSLSGSSLYLIGQNTGSSTITICQSNTTICGNLYATVNGTGSGLTFSPTSVNVGLNQSSTVTISGGSGSYYISSNSSPSVAAVSLQSASLYVTGLNSGTTSVNLCQSNNTSVCGTLAVTVGGSTSAGGAISFSNGAPVLTVGQSQSIIINGGSGGSYYVSSISNPAIITLNLTGSSISLTGAALGSTTLTICQTGSSVCGSLNVTVNTTGATTSGGSIYFTTTSLPAAAFGQSYSFQLQAQGGNGNYTYTLTSGSLPTGVTLSPAGLISGTPTGDGSINLAVGITVTDSSGATGVGNFSLLINAGTNTSLPAPTPTPTVSATPTSSNPYPNGELINENGTIYIVYQNTKVGFANAPAFLGLGFKFANVSNVTSSGLAVSPKVVVTANGGHPRGTWVLSGKAVYFVTPGGLIPVPDWNTFLNNGGQAGFIVPANRYDLAYAKLSVMTTNDARLQP